MARRHRGGSEKSRTSEILLTIAGKLIVRRFIVSQSVSSQKFRQIWISMEEEEDERGEAIVDNELKLIWN